MATGFENAEEFPAGDDVKARAETCEEIQDSEIRVGFDGVADQMVKGSERGVEALVVSPDGSGGIHIGGRAEAVGDFTKVHSLAAQGAINV
jgi:hypothetical protein